MSDLWINIRIGCYHIQAECGSLKVRVTRNDYWGQRWNWIKAPVAVYDFKPMGWRKAI